MQKNIFPQKSLRKSAHFSKDSADLYGSSRFSTTIFPQPCRKTPTDVHIFAKVENVGLSFDGKELLHTLVEVA